jgi:hypothetical protein
VTKYLYDVPFSTPAATDQYRDGWEAIFGKKPEPTSAKTASLWGDHDSPEKPCPCESSLPFEECHGLPYKP